MNLDLRVFINFLLDIFQSFDYSCFDIHTINADDYYVF